jgi:hypothetical protein
MRNETAPLNDFQNCPSHEPTTDEIAECAYYIWQSEGCPEGKEAEHWHHAQLQLFMGRVHDGALETQKNRQPAFPAKTAKSAQIKPSKIIKSAKKPASVPAVVMS